MSEIDKHIDYDKIARKCDGKPARLNQHEQAVYDELVADSKIVLPSLNVTMPAAALKRAQKRAHAGSHKVGRVLYALGIGVGIAVAATIVLTAVVNVLTPDTKTPGPSYQNGTEHVTSDPIDSPDPGDSGHNAVNENDGSQPPLLPPENYQPGDQTDHDTSDNSLHDPQENPEDSNQKWDTGSDENILKN